MAKLPMRFRSALVAALIAATVPGIASAQQKDDTVDLQTVLHKMDATAAKFQSAQADFAWDQYVRVVNETDTQKGTVYYRRAGKEIEMMADIKEPAPKAVLFTDGKLRVFYPKMNQVEEYGVGKNRGEVESFLVIGFGGSGQDLLKAFDVSFGGEETLNGVRTAKLQLVPKSDKLKANFPSIELWIDLERGVSIQQKLSQSQGDYRLARYSGIHLNEKMPAETFQLKTNSKTQYVSPRG
jgi:outer membrane lipoprotein-sorting protein